MGGTKIGNEIDRLRTEGTSGRRDDRDVKVNVRKI